MPCTYDGSSLNGPDALPGGPARTRPGSPCPDAPLGDGYLLDRLGGAFVLLTIDAAPPEAIEVDGIAACAWSRWRPDEPSGALAERYLGEAPAAVYLIRPDQHVAARWTSLDEAAVRAAIRTASGRG